MKNRQMNICSSQGGGNQFAFYPGTDRAAFTANASVVIGSKSVYITPQPMLLDTGSAFNVFDYRVAFAIATNIKSLWPLSLARRDGLDNSTCFQPSNEVKSKVMNLIRRQNPSVFYGPYPSYVNTLALNFFVISCSSGTISITLNGVAYSIPATNYVFKDPITGFCYSAFVGVTALINTAFGEISTFSILGQPFIRSPTINAISVNHDTSFINIS